ncbi:bromodomain adjacent to zinc finger domain protein 2B-like isoform X3 [Acanthaster planci]|uniref:Bromodomain adjacent to zinc finger domain protein 2B-like isoform X3 n=1 Tax=Acanthaster planci TaxID=133434 RepID=A0A8B7ZSS7_ACAPL|nr:bromodomain adjacent to zinc finger domain protein 2B-like isoform X3 [Acanthaster planci]
MEQGEGSSQKSPVGSLSSSFFDTSHQISQPLYSQPSTSHDSFPLISHVPSAFSMFGHNAYSAAAAAAAGRPLGSEFGGLGSLVSESLSSPLRSPTAISTHSPISPSTGWSFEASAQLFSLAALGGSPWWQQSHSLGALGHDYYSHSLGLSTTFGHGTSADKEASVAGFDSLFKSQKTPKTNVSGTGAVRRGTGRRGRPRKTDRPNPLRVPLLSQTPTLVPSHQPAPLTTPKEAVSVIKEVPKLSIKVSTPSPSLSSPRQRSSKSPSPRTSLPSSSPALSPQKKKSSSASSKDPGKQGSSDSSDNGLSSGDSDSNMSEVSSGDSGSDSDQYSDEKEMAEIMQAKKELEARQKLLLEQQKSIREKQQSSLNRKQKAGLLSPKEGQKSSASNEQRSEKKHHHRHGDQHRHHHHHHRKSGQERKQPKDAVLTEKELQEQLLREQEQKRRAEQLTLQFEQQIKEQQQQLRMQKRAQAEREKLLLAEKARLERGQTSSTGGRERKPGRPRKENREETTRGGKMKGKGRAEKRQKTARNLELQVNGTQGMVTVQESAAQSVEISPAPSVSAKAKTKQRGGEKGEAGPTADKEGGEHSDSVGDVTGVSDDCQDVSSDSGSALDTDDDNYDDDDDLEKTQRENSEDTDASTMARESQNSPMPMNILLKRKADHDSNLFAAYMPVQRKRLRVTDERAVRRPLSRGWRRQVIIRQLGPGDRVKGDVLYYGPCGKKLRTYPEVMRYIQRRGIVDVGREHFSFSAKIRIGEFLNPKPDNENVGGIIFEKLTESELQQRINILMGRKPRPGRPVKNAERKRIAQELARRAAEVKHRKKIEHQAEMVRRIQEAKMRRKLERQQQAHLAREARRQQALQAAEEKRRAKEHRLFLKQQQKRSRMEQLRMEREMRAHQMVEDRKKRKQAEIQSKMMEAFKRAKEREMRRQHAVLLKHQERERRKHMLIMERERRKQHMMLVRALEARKKQEEKERQKNEKKVEKRAKKDRKMQQRILEMQMAKELKKPVEDMKLGQEAKPLPNIERLNGLKLPGQAFANCLMTLEFLHTFCDALNLDKEDDIPTMTTLQAGLLNETEYIGEVIALAIQLLALALEDPGTPDNHPEKSPWGQSVEDIDITEDNLSEMLRYYIIGVNGKDDEIGKLLSTVPFKALSAVQKASVLAFLVNQLVCSRPVIQQIEGGIDKVTNLRRDKWIVEGKLRKLRTLRSKQFDNKVTPKQEPGTSTPTLNGTPEKQNKKVSNEDDDDDEKDDDEDDMSGGEEGAVGGAVEEDGGAEEEVEVESLNEGVEEIEKKMERLSKQHGQFRHKIFEASHSLRAIAFGQDRYRRRYWVLPHAGGILVEGLESAEPNMFTVDNTATKLEKETLEQSKIETETSKEEVTTEEQEVVKGDKEKDSEEIEEEKKQDEETKETTMDTSCSANTQETNKSETETSCSEDRTVPSSSNTQEEEVRMEVTELRLENDQEELESADNKRTENVPQVNGEIALNGPVEQDTREDLYMEAPLNLTKVDKSHDDGTQQTETIVGSTVNKDEACKAETSTSTVSAKMEPSESSEDGDRKSPIKKNSPKLGYLSIDSMLQRSDRPASSSSSSPFPPITSSSIPPPSLSLDSKPNGAMGSWFSILPRMPCDDTSLLTSPIKQEEETPTPNDAFSDQFKQAAQAVPAFGLTPYGIYHVPFPLMHVGQMNAFMGAYSFPGVAPIPLQTLQMNQMDQTASVNPLLPLANTIKLKTEQEEEDEEEEADLKAIANMQALLDQMEKAQTDPVPEDLQQGWWQICDPNMLRLITRSLHMRGIRERMLQKSFQKYNDFSLRVCSKGIKNDILIQTKEKKTTYPDNNSIPRIPPPVFEEQEGWFQEVTFAANRGILESVEAMEERVFSASMQVKGWVLPEKVSNDPNLESWQTVESSGVDPIGIAIKRLLALEKSVERRYLKPPLSKTENAIKVASQGQPVTESAASRSRGSAAAVALPEESLFPKAEEEPSKGLVRWRRTVENATSASRLHMCLNVLEKCIAWDKSIMKVFCQLCRKGDNEALLLLCDGCDKGFHTYCIKPKKTQIPEGDWYCSVCISKATGEPGTCTECQKTGKLLKCEQCPRAYHLNCLDPVLSKFPRGKWFCPPCQKVKRKASKSRNHKRKSKDKKEKGHDKGHHSGHHSGRSTPAETPSSPAVSVDKEAQKEEKAAKKKEMAPCKLIMTELEKEENSWPFLVPVNTKQFPSYRKIIKKPMDFSTIRARLHAGHYHHRDEFAADVRVVFDNCETFNEDDSDVGRAGHEMRAFFESRWADILQEQST